MDEGIVSFYDPPAHTDPATWLFHHLTTAQAARRALDRASSWSREYHEALGTLQRAIAAATVHYRALVKANALPAHLAELALAVGLRP